MNRTLYGLVVTAYLYVAIGFVNFVLVVAVDKRKVSASHASLLDFALRFLRSLFGAFSVNLGVLVYRDSKRLINNMKIGRQSNLRPVFFVVLPLYTVVQIINLIQVLTSDEECLRYGRNFLFKIQQLETLRPTVFVHWMIFILLSIVPGLLVSDYVELCVYLKRRIAAVCEQMDDFLRSKTLSCDDLNEVQLHIHSGWQYLRSVDKLYSTLAFAWFIDMIITVVLSIRSVMRGSHSVFFAFDAIFYLFLFFVLAVKASDIDREAKKLQDKIYSLRTVATGDHVEINGRIMMIENSLKQSRLVLNSGYFCRQPRIKRIIFSIDRPFIVAVLGAMATYTILLVQLAPQ